MIGCREGNWWVEIETGRFGQVGGGLGFNRASMAPVIDGEVNFARGFTSYVDLDEGRFTFFRTREEAELRATKTTKEKGSNNETQR